MAITVRFIGCLLILVLWGPLSQASSQATQAQLETLKSKIKKLNKDLSRQRKETTSIDYALRDSEKRIANISSRMRDYENRIQQLTGDNQDLSQKSTDLAQAIAKRRHLIVRLMRQQYRLGQQPRLQLLLMQQQPQDLMRVMKYFDIANNQSLEELQEFRQQLQTLKQYHSQMRQNEVDVQAKLAALQKEHSHMKQEQGKRRKVLARLKASVKSTESRLKALNQDRKQLLAVFAEVKRSISEAKLVIDDTTFRERRGHMHWPVTGKILRPYHSQSGNIAYDGVLIAAKPRQDVNAVHHGRVVFADWLRGYGQVIILDHGDGYMSLYGHNQSMLKEVCEWVDTDQTIALAGSSGGNHSLSLYFAIRHQGAAVNPMRWLARAP